MKRIDIELLAHDDRTRLVHAYADLPPALLDMPATQDQHDPDAWWTAKDHFAHQARVTEQVMLMISQGVFGSHDVSALRPDELVAIGHAETLAELRHPVENLMKVAHEATNRWRGSVKMLTRSDSVDGITRAAPTPITPRHATRPPGLDAVAAPSEAPTKTRSPTFITPLRPKRSPSLPAVRSRPANTRM